MQDPERILGYSTLIVLVIVSLLISGRGLAAYQAVFRKESLGYRFERSRLRLSLAIIAASFALCFVYGYLISEDSGLALGFALVSTFFVTICCLVNYCFVSKNKN